MTQVHDSPRHRLCPPAPPATVLAGILAAALLIALIAPVAFVWQVRSVRPSLFATGTPPVTDRPIQVEMDGYVTSRACAACHPHHYATWHASYHRTMTQVATPASVVGRFDGKWVEAYGVMLRPRRRGDEFFIDLAASSRDAAAPEWKLVMTTGLHHMQVYWYSSGRGRNVAMAPIVWLRDAQRWVPEPSSFLRPPTRKLQSGDPRWSYVCQECHATGQQPRLSADPKEGVVDTVVAELGIACEACHGPGARHVEIHRNPLRRYVRHLSDDGADPSIVNPARLTTERSSQVCGQCHAISFPRTPEEQERAWTSGRTYRPDDDLMETRWIVDGRDRSSPRPQNVLASDPHFYEDRYWSDGMVRVSGREYQGLLDSPCYADAITDERRLSCMSCHQLHPDPDDPRALSEWADDQLRPGAAGDEACLQCHEAFRANPTRHTRHAVASSGSRCQNCHMPHTTYGLLKAIRSHTIDSPGVQAELATGRPNACNACHLDRTLRWTARHLREGYDIPEPELTEEQATFAAGILWLSRGDAGQRALAAWAAGWPAAQEASGTDWMAPFVAPLLADPYDAVRYIAERSLRGLPGLEDLDYDFLGAPADRHQAVQEARIRWERIPRETGQPREALLLDDAGRLDLFIWKSLRDGRDDSRVYLQE